MAQQPGAEPADDLVFRSTSLLIEVTVAVEDSQGNSITDLTKSDFVLTDNGKRRDVSLFIAGTPAAPTVVPKTPGKFSNASTGREHANHTVILLDRLNTQWSDYVNSRQAVVRVLEGLQPQDKVALYTLDTQLRIVHEFDTDRESLLKTIASLRGSGGPDPVASPTDPLTDASVSQYDDTSSGPDWMPKEMKLMRLENQVQTTIRAFQEIAAHLSGMPGRKAVIWLSSAFPLQVDSTVVRGAKLGERTYTKEVGRAIQALNQADVALYPVDARGLPLLPVPGAVVASMNQIAQRTGGRTFRNSNDLDVSMRRVLDGVKLSYTLGFYAAAEPGEHRLRVRVSRPNMVLRYRENYSIGNSDKQERIATADELRRVLASPLDTTRIPFEVEARRVEGDLLLKVSIAAKELREQQLQGGFAGTLQAAVRFTRVDGTLAGEVRGRTLKLNLKPDVYETATTVNVPLGSGFPIPAGAATVRVVIQGSQQGSIGTLTFPLARVPVDAAKGQSN